jgi:two-component system C4-dicarboxylate transport response regulator DctD
VPRKTLHDKLRKHGLNFTDAAGAHNSGEELD